MTEFLQSPLVQSALAGAVAAIVIDLRKYKQWQDGTNPGYRFSWIVLAQNAALGAAFGVVAYLVPGALPAGVN